MGKAQLEYEKVNFIMYIIKHLDVKRLRKMFLIKEIEDLTD